MNFLDILSYIPGLKGFNVKYTIEIFSSQIIKHAGHKVNKYNAMLNFETGFIEFMVFHPDFPNCPDQYKNPTNLRFKGQVRNEVPDGARLYDMDVKSAIDTIKDFVGSQLQDFKGEINYLLLFVNRNEKEIPCEVYYTTETGEKTKLKHILK